MHKDCPVCNSRYEVVFGDAAKQGCPICGFEPINKDLINCSKCNHQNDTNNEKCENCGEKLQKKYFKQEE